MLPQRSRITLCCLLLSGLICGQVRGEYYSSVDSLQTLGHLEARLVSATYLYLVERGEQLDVLHSFAQRIKREHDEIGLQLQDGHNVQQPLLAFRLIKRLVVDWKELHKQLAENQPKQKYQQTVDDIFKADQQLPDQKELQGAVKGLRILQSVYNISASELAAGVLNGVSTGSTLLWQDCFEIGVQFYELARYREAQEWLKLAANRLAQVDGEHGQRMAAEVYEYLALTYGELGDKEKAVAILEERLSWLPPDAQHPSRYTLDYLANSMPKCPDEEAQNYWFDNFSRLCQGKRVPEPQPRGDRLTCYLDFKRHARFQLSPLKVEQLHLDPDIHMYHGLLTDAQIEAILRESEKFERARSLVSQQKVFDLRVSQHAWVPYNSTIMAHIKYLVSAISGLDLANAEDMQVANYGIGGLYAPHFDYQSYVPKHFIHRGNRISTNMFYLSDVLQGGYTVFPNLNLFLRPEKGALVIWNNLHRSLKFDYRTFHAGCPVLNGAKRIGNIWIRTTLQELRRPCTLNADE